MFLLLVCIVYVCLVWHHSTQNDVLGLAEINTNSEISNMFECKLNWCILDHLGAAVPSAGHVGSNRIKQTQTTCTRINQ